MLYWMYDVNYVKEHEQKENSNQTYWEVGFWKNHGTIDHLVTLQVLTKEMQGAIWLLHKLQKSFGYGALLETLEMDEGSIEH